MKSTFKNNTSGYSKKRSKYVNSETERGNPKTATQRKGVNDEYQTYFHQFSWQVSYLDTFPSPNSRKVNDKTLWKGCHLLTDILWKLVTLSSLGIHSWRHSAIIITVEILLLAILTLCNICEFCLLVCLFVCLLACLFVRSFVRLFVGNMMVSAELPIQLILVGASHD